MVPIHCTMGPRYKFLYCNDIDGRFNYNDWWSYTDHGPTNQRRDMKSSTPHSWVLVGRSRKTYGWPLLFRDHYATNTIPHDGLPTSIPRWVIKSDPISTTTPYPKLTPHQKPITHHPSSPVWIPRQGRVGLHYTQDFTFMGWTVCYQEKICDLLPKLSSLSKCAQILFICPFLRPPGSKLQPSPLIPSPPPPSPSLTTPTLPPPIPTPTIPHPSPDTISTTGSKHTTIHILTPLSHPIVVSSPHNIPSRPSPLGRKSTSRYGSRWN